MAAPRANLVPIAPRQGQIVAGTQVGITHAQPEAIIAHTKYGHGKVNQPRKKRRCKRCKMKEDPRSEICKGANGRTGGSKNCQYYDENGEKKSDGESDLIM